MEVTLIFDVIIIGSGPAGLSCATGLHGLNVLLLEKEKKISSKLRLSGAGQCNISHAGNVLEFKENYGRKWRFVRQALTGFSNDDLISMLNKRGLNFITRDDGKIFPSSLDAGDVIATLGNWLNELGIKINTGEEVIDVYKEDIFTVTTNKQVYKAKNVVVATGGITYPKTGSTGYATKLSKAFNLPFVPYRFALAPVYVKDHDMADLMGLSFESITIDHYRNKKLGTYKGDLLVTHFGFSGPLIINASRAMEKSDELYINFIGLESGTFEKNLLGLLEKHPKKKIKSVLEGVPNRLIDHVINKFDLTETKCSDLKKDDRKKIVNFLTSYKVVIDQVGKSHIAMVSAGGIDTSCLSKKTYESTIAGLYFIGECVDVDGDTGGYNIQYAFSSGQLAARHIQEVLNE